MIGRGGKRGTTAGRGTKGQKARAGHRIRPALRDAIKSLPKRRGRGKNIFKRFRPRARVLNLGLIDRIFRSGDLVSPRSLKDKHLVGAPAGGGRIKILAAGALTKPLNFKGVAVSAAGREKIKRAGGTSD